MVKRRGAMENRLTRFYHWLTERDNSPLDVPNWSKYRKLYAFQEFIDERLGALHWDHEKLLRRYYIDGETITATERVEMVQVRKAWESTLTEEDKEWLRTLE